MTKSKGIRSIRTEAGGTAKYNIGDIVIRPNGTRWKVGEDRNKTDEQRKAEETMIMSARIPDVNDFGEKEASMQ